MDAIELLQALVRIPSPNPPGDTQTLAMYIAQLLEQAGCRVQRLAPPSKPEALSVVASVGQGDPVIMLHAHIDTVPIAVTESHRWQFDPYAAEVHEGKLYGKGSIDDKAPLAAMMLTVLEAASDESRVRGTLVLVAAAEEEVGGQLGTRWLADHAHLPKCDFIVVGEQTHNRVANAHKGVMRATIQTLGKAVHATNPDRGSMPLPQWRESCWRWSRIIMT
ncbi:MAG UNVERIFIED_CONTAM: M20/M25/M40 family metallo-hydrolase [Anaerolineae bacterium]|jgi:acetylornithine deacetylase/succinyl-diaminopimelate desuccinylase-like protein